MGVIEDMYGNSAKLLEKSMDKDKEYMKAKNQVKQHYKFLCQNL